MLFTDWHLDRLVVHEIPLREEERVNPVYGTALTTLDRNACDTFFKRVQMAMSKDAKCMEMNIVKTAAGSYLTHTEKLLATGDDNEFLSESRPFADLLVNAQTSRAIPAGILIIFTGTVEFASYRFVGAIKAEAQDGFTRQRDANGITLKLLNDLFLTPSSRMYKIGLFIEKSQMPALDAPLEANYSAFVYDHLMSKQNRDAAATYFYEGFLGCGFPQDAARLTKNFLQLTRKFIFSNPAFTEEEKYDLYADLQSYLRSADRVVHVSAFAERHITTPQIRDEYTSFMRDNEFSPIAVPKDTKDIKSSLTSRKVTFGSSIKLQGPAEKMDELVVIEKIDGPENENGLIPAWTKITIKDRPRELE